MTAIAGTFRTLSLSIAGALAAAGVSWAGPDSTANVIVNGDFSADARSFVGWPGYINFDAAKSGYGTGINPTAITDWTHNGAGTVGVNGMDTSTDYYSPPGGPIVPFGPSSQLARPDRNWVFLQYQDAAVYQVINVIPGYVHRVSFEAAGRAGMAALGSVYVFDGTTFLEPKTGIESKAYNDAVFEPDSFEFTPTVSRVVLVLQNAGGGDTINFTGVSIIPATGPVER